MIFIHVTVAISIMFINMFIAKIIIVITAYVTIAIAKLFLVVLSLSLSCLLCGRTKQEAMVPAPSKGARQLLSLLGFRV